MTLMHIPNAGELRAKRELLGVTQAHLARMAGISQSMIARIEAGSVDPRVSTLTKIVAVLNQCERPRFRAADVMHTPVHVVAPGDPVASAVGMMERHSISQLPVVEGGIPVGCISESAMVQALEEGTALPGQKGVVREFMEPGFPTVPPESDIRTVAHLLHDHHAVLVVEGGKVAGVITKHDLISLISQD
jgi:predicted transcriptional regulator